jgi:glutamine amidotransferase-like uncharacterized protein
MAAVSDLSQRFAQIYIDDDPYRVVLYNGPGAAPGSVSTTQIALSVLLNTSVRLVDAAFFQNAYLLIKAKLIVIAGGNALTISAALGEKGRANLTSAILNWRLPYIGICAGALLACRTTTISGVDVEHPFGANMPFAFHGAAALPVLNKGATFKSSESVEMVRKIAIKTREEVLIGYSYYLDGPSFVNPKSYHNVKVLGHYIIDESLPLKSQPAAIIHCTYDDINAVLCGPHPETTTPYLYSDKTLPEASLLSPVFSHTVMRTMLIALGFLKNKTSLKTLLKGIGIIKKPITPLVPTGIEALPSSVHYLINSYCVETPFTEKATPFLQFLPPLQKEHAFQLITYVENLRLQLIKVVANRFTEGSKIEGDRTFQYAKVFGDKDKNLLLKKLDIQTNTLCIKVQDLVNMGFTDVIPFNAKYLTLDKYVDAMEAS